MIIENTDKKSCEAFGCDVEAAEAIEVSAGKFGTITLLVCRNCISKFEEY